MALPSTQHSSSQCSPQCCGKPFLYGNPEALGWLLNAVARSVYFIGQGAFLLPALVDFATKDAGCVPDEECTNKVYGMRPSSLITVTATIISVFVAILTPLMGAWLDYTPHRRVWGRSLSALFCLLILPQVFTNSNTWFWVQISLLIMGIVMFAQDLVVHAYLPELTNKAEQLNQMIKTIGIITGLCLLVFLLLVLGIASVLDRADDDVVTARISSIVSMAVCIPFFWISWAHLMPQRPAAHNLPDHQRLWTAGFQQVYRTTRKIYRDYKALGWFYVAIVFGDVKPISSIIVTFYQDQLQFTPTQTGLAALILLVSAIPGAILSAWVTRRYNPIYSSMVSMGIIILFSTLSAIVLKGPETPLVLAFLMGAGWGVGVGVKGTSSRMLVSAISPVGQEAELMGYYLFADSVLSWLPPLVFTVMNEAGISQRIGLASLNVYFLLALCAFYQIGDYKAAVAAAGRMTEEDDDDNAKLNSLDRTQEDLEASEVPELADPQPKQQHVRVEEMLEKELSEE